MQEMDECEAAKKVIQEIKLYLSLKPAAAKKEIKNLIEDYEGMLALTKQNKAGNSL